MKQRHNRHWRVSLIALGIALLWAGWLCLPTAPAHADAVCSSPTQSISLNSRTSLQSGSSVRCFVITDLGSNQAFTVNIEVQDSSGQYDLYLMPGSPTVLSDLDRYNFRPITQNTFSSTARVESNADRYTIAVAPVGTTLSSSRYVVSVKDYRPTALNDSCVDGGDDCTPHHIPLMKISELAASQHLESAFQITCPNTRIVVKASWSGGANVKFSLISPNRTEVVSYTQRDQQNKYTVRLNYTAKAADLRSGGRWWAVLTNTARRPIGGGSLGPITVGPAAPVASDGSQSQAPTGEVDVTDTSGDSISSIDVTVPQDDTSCPIRSNITVPASRPTATFTPRPSLPTATPTRIESGQLDSRTGRVNTNSNLRAGPGTNNAIVGSLSRGAEVTIIGNDSNGTWYQLDRPGGPWIYAPLIDIISSQPSQQQTFRNGQLPGSFYQGANDTTIREDDPQRNFGTETICYGDGDDPPGSGADSSVLLSWDVGSIPAGSRITAASIHLYVVDGSDERYPLYAVNRNWDENSASWRSYRSGSDWQQIGAQGSTDRSGEPIGVLDRPSTGPVEIPLNAAGIALVQQWVTQSSSNNGVVLANSGAINGVDFVCSEHSNASQRPMLAVVYIP